jgi:NitT/TauT family transport system substrate-binding protein
VNRPAKRPQNEEDQVAERGLRILFAAMAMLLLGGGADLHAQGRKVVVQNGAAAPALDTARLDIAKELGFFREEGLDVEIRYGAGAALAAQLTANDKIDLSVITYEPVIVGYDKGIRGKFFYQTTSRVIYYIAVPEESPIKTAADLAGRKIGVVGLGSAAVTVAKSIARGAGVSPDNLTFLPVGFGDQAASALRGNRVDVLALWDGGYAPLISSGMKLRFIRHPKLVDGGNAALFASDKTIAERKEDLQRFARAFTKASVFAQSNPEAAIKLFWKANPGAKRQGDEAEAMRRARIEMDFVVETFGGSGKPGHVNRKLFDAYAETILEDQPGAKPPTAAELVTDDLLALSDGVNTAAVEAAAKTWKEP